MAEECLRRRVAPAEGAEDLRRVRRPPPSETEREDGLAELASDGAYLAASGVAWVGSELGLDAAVAALGLGGGGIVDPWDF